VNATSQAVARFSEKLAVQLEQLCAAGTAK
jgi:hypothetical protein